MRANYLGPVGQFKEILLDLIDPPIRAGAPGPPEEYRRRRVDLNKLLMDNIDASFLWFADGESMNGIGIRTDDLLVIDRSLEAIDGDIVVAGMNGENTVKRLSVEEEKVLLLPENPSYKPIPVNPEEGILIFGVVTLVIHPLRLSYELRRRLNRLQ
jgi:DNA polymerase V